MGRMVAAIERAYRFQQPVDRNERILLGVNRYQSQEEAAIQTLYIDETVGQLSADTCKAHHAMEAVMMFRASLLTAVAASVTLALVMASGPTLEGQEARGRAALMNPAELNEEAPATFNVNFDTSAGLFVVEVHRDWAPIGVDRFYNLVKRGFYDGTRFFRVLPGYIAQFGISGDPVLHDVWRVAYIPDDSFTGLAVRDPNKQSNEQGYIAFVQVAGRSRRTTQLYINLVDNPGLDKQDAAPFGRVVSGMGVVEKLYSGYGEGAPHGNGPDQNRFYAEGNAYLSEEFPQLDYVKMATLVP